MADLAGGHCEKEEHVLFAAGEACAKVKGVGRLCRGDADIIVKA
jgi:hypothetical protein